MSEAAAEQQRCQALNPRGFEADHTRVLASDRLPEYHSGSPGRYAHDPAHHRPQMVSPARRALFKRLLSHAGGARR